MKISKAIDKIFGVVDSIIKSTSEESPGGKKVTLAEGIGIAISGIGLIPVFTSFNQLKEDWASRDSVKKAEWIEAFKDRFDLSNDKVEEQIEGLVEALLALEGSILGLANK
ncbi:MAG TPA: hypothetical protein DDX98_09280 [Bacteroidales bacterium]|jgi:hypothetical protein|nr:hypothetical protein [Bacteroidales bacterium]